MNKQRQLPWFWNTAILTRLVVLLLAMVLATYASHAMANWGWF